MPSARCGSRCVRHSLSGCPIPRRRPIAADPARGVDPGRAPLDAALDRVDRRRERRRADEEARQRLVEPLRRRQRKAGPDEVGVDEAEVGAAHPGSRRCRLHPERVAQRLDPRLGRRVGAHQGRMGDRRERGDVQQVAARAGDLADHGAVGPPDAHQVHVDRPFELLGDAGGDRAAEGDAGVCDRDVDRRRSARRSRRRPLRASRSRSHRPRRRRPARPAARPAARGARARVRRVPRWRRGRGGAPPRRLRSRWRRRSQKRFALPPRSAPWPSPPSLMKPARGTIR